MAKSVSRRTLKKNGARKGSGKTGPEAKLDETSANSILPAKSCKLWFLKKWWFYPLALVYVLFGLWFGSLSWNVAENPDRYSRNFRFALYPIQEFSTNGIMCSYGRNEINYCMFGAGGKLNQNTFTGPNFLKKTTSTTAVARSAYLTNMAILWPAKMLFNIIVGIGIFVIFLSGGTFLLITSVWYLALSLIFSGIALLL